MKRTLFIIACMLTSMTMLAQEESNNYIPFVEAGKTWHVESSSSNGEQYYKFLTYRMDEKVELDGKTYFKLKQEGDTDADVSDIGLFREENGRVYTYDNMLDRDVMLYDFSLKEGDSFTYEIDPNSPMNCKVLKQGWLYNGPQIVSSVIPISPDSMEIRYRQLRTWSIGREIGPGEYQELSTWVEGVGSLKDMFIYPLSVGGNCSLAYVERTDHETNYSKNSYLPFSFYNSYGRVHGCDLPIDVKVQPGDGHSQLTYDLEGDHMHVYGKVYAQAGNTYAYFIEEETDDPLVRKLHFQIEDVDPIPTTMGLHATEFYVPGLNPNFDYIIVDNQGEEHPVVNRTPQKDYRPFVEDGKVWKVGAISSGNPVQWVEYYYFDGDTIIDGKTCKQMMCQRYVSPGFVEYSAVSGSSALNYIGAWYEEDKKVYEYDMTSREFQLMYDFSFEDPDTLLINHQPYVIGPKLTGGMKGFKGVYRDVMMSQDGESFYRSTPWLESVGGVYGPPTINVFNVELGDPAWSLMSCTVGDEVIYLNDAYEDGATPVDAEARKRIDFTHTIKIRPKSRTLRETRQSLYGEYNDQQLGVNLVPLDDAYLVRIADETGRAVYEKAINAGSIVGLTIDISDYAKGHYTVTVENSLESFTGEFETQTTGISNALRPMKDEGIRNNHIYDLQGRRLTQKPTKGVYILDGKKRVVK